MSQNYPERLRRSIFHLGRMYLEMGYFAAAERIFSGLVVLSENLPEASLGLGLVKLERGRTSEAINYFRASGEHPEISVQAKLGLCCAFLAANDKERAASILSEVKLDNTDLSSAPVRQVYQALCVACDLS